MKVTFNSPAAAPASTGGGSGGILLAVVAVLGIGYLLYNHFSAPAVETEEGHAEVVK